MIADVLLLLKARLNDYVNAQTGRDPSEASEDSVVFLDGEKMDPVSFRLGTVTLLLVNLEEENTVRAAERYRRAQPDGSVLAVQPDIRLNLFVLFAASFRQYDLALRYLSLVIRYFQAHRFLDRRQAPELPSGLDKLTFELVTLPFSQQNEIWSGLRASYHPSALYKVGLVVFSDAAGDSAAQIAEADVKLSGEVAP